MLNLRYPINTKLCDMIISDLRDWPTGLQ